MKRFQVLPIVLLVILSVMPLYAYADPSGGTLFQVLMPILAGIWAMWMILATRLRRSVSNFVRKLRGSEPDGPAV